MLESIISMIKPFFEKILGTVGKIISHEIDKRFSFTEHDEKVYKKYKEIFPESTISFLRNENFSRRFTTEMDDILEAIDEGFFFVPAYIFHNKKLKKASDKVIKASYKLHEETWRYVFPRGSTYGIDRHRHKLPEINEYSHDLVLKLDILFLACDKLSNKVLEK